jgi:ornithine carbamoyltransferase
VSLACPKGYRPDEKCVKDAQAIARKTGSAIEVTVDPQKAARQADVLYTDVWVSMGQDQETQERLNIFRPYQINASLLSVARRDCIVLHCLPAHRGQEITEEVLEGAHSRVFQEAENRLHTQKALLALLLSQDSKKFSSAARK